MHIFVPKESRPGERRVPLVPESVTKLIKAGLTVTVEAGMGAGALHTDTAYSEAGAQIAADRQHALNQADIVLRINKPPLEEIALLKHGALHISFLDPFNERELVTELASRNVSAISMEMIPRTTRAQKMDALSSQANIAGYVAVIIAAERLSKILPMMMTPAGTISPSRVFIIGAGVAGLQAIATAKRLGARVEAFDTRPVVEEQVRSLGAKFVKVDLGETGQTKDGYAKELTEEQKLRQREAMAKVCAQADIVITTAQIFGKRAPIIVTREMIAGMKPGSIVVDLAVETGGNVEGAELDQEVDINGVRVIGLGNLPGRAAVHASQMYSSNITSLVLDLWKSDSKSLTLNTADEIVRGCLITQGGEIVNETIRKIYESAKG